MESFLAVTKFDQIKSKTYGVQPEPRKIIANFHEANMSNKTHLRFGSVFLQGISHLGIIPDDHQDWLL